MQRLGWTFGTVICGLWALALHAPAAHACGGLFCNASNPVNQAAERIIFAHNGDGTVTAAIEIKYEGPSSAFSWVLPVPGVPKVEVSSVAALDRLQQATNPTYTLNTTFEGDCPIVRSGGAPTANGVDDSDSGGESGVVVLAAGTVGPFDYEVISLDPALSDPADAALQWLMDNEYEVTALAPSVLGPYLANGLNLIAFRLTKGNDSGSVRPILITYEAELPFIPIRPTAVAANDDMGMLIWVVAAERAIPKNYKALELNEALIDWFNPMGTYDKVVSAAADEANGQGFVTELARPTDSLEGVVVQPWERDNWAQIMAREYSSPLDFVLEAADYYSQWDGFGDAVKAAVTLPEGISLADFLGCPRCYADEPDFVLDESGFRQALYTNVIKPMFDTEQLVQSRPYVTRLYTTMSADEMTTDPLFDLNGELGDVDNQHTADRVIDCKDDSWRVELASGDVVFGSEAGVWPELEDQPAARRIMQLTTQGSGKVVTDNRDTIRGILMSAAPAGQDDKFPPLDADAGLGDDESQLTGSDGGLCSTAPGQNPGASFALVALALLPLWRRRRRA